MYHNLFIHSHVGGYFWMDVFWYLCAWVSLGYGFKSGDAESWPMHTSRVKPHCQRWKSQFICLLTIYESSLCSTSSLASKIRLKFSSIGWMKICIAMWFTFLSLVTNEREHLSVSLLTTKISSFVKCLIHLLLIFPSFFGSFSCLFVRVLYILNTHVLY